MSEFYPFEIKILGFEQAPEKLRIGDKEFIQNAFFIRCSITNRSDKLLLIEDQDPFINYPLKITINDSEGNIEIKKENSDEVKVIVKKIHNYTEIGSGETIEFTRNVSNFFDVLKFSEKEIKVKIIYQEPFCQPMSNIAQATISFNYK